MSELTAKNSDYVHSVTKQLMLAGKTDDEVKAILEEIIPQILEGQKNGILARNLLGTPTEFTENYKVKEGEQAPKYTNDDPKFVILDSILLIFALLAVLYGLMFSFQSTQAYYGVTTLVLSSIAGGLAMYQVYRAQSKLLERDKNLTRWQRFRPTFVLMGYMMLWMFVTIVSNFLPAALNPHLPGTALIVLGAIVFGIRYLVKRKFNIQSAMATRPTVQRK